ncbi:MAG: iron ABC transporter permease [Phycisphaerales bacterium]|nr:iron ABC transporter permease [Phycisphaerales bacterium]
MAGERTSVPARTALLLALLGGAMWLRMAVGRDPSTGALEWVWPDPAIGALRAGAMWSAVVAGASLGLSGLLLQVLLRNPLASPFVLGLSSGAGLGATLAAWSAGAAGVAGTGGWIAALAATGAIQVLPAMAGALITLGIVLVLGMRRGVIEPVSMVLAGTVVAAICGAITLLVQYAMPPASRADAAIWFMGRVPELPDRAVLIAAIAVLAAAALWSGISARTFDAASVSDEEARSLGVRLVTLRLGMYVAAGATAATSVALCGPIAFVGFVAPHMARLLLGARHGPLVLGSVVAGALVLVVADVVRQALDLGMGRMPVGVLTALVGGPAFLLVLRSSRLAHGSVP